MEVYLNIIPRPREILVTSVLKEFCDITGTDSELLPELSCVSGLLHSPVLELQNDSKIDGVCQMLNRSIQKVKMKRIKKKH